MNLIPLFTASKVVTAIYRISSTSLMLYYLVQHVSKGQKNRRVDRKMARVYRYSSERYHHPDHDEN